jgi:hypothetical protein
MRSVGQQTPGLTSTVRDNPGNENKPQAPRYSLEAIIALQRALQNGIPQNAEEQAEMTDELVSLNGKSADEDSATHTRPLTLMLAEIGRFFSAAVRRLRRSRLQKSTAGQR